MDFSRESSRQLSISRVGCLYPNENRAAISQKIFFYRPRLFCQDRDLDFLLVFQPNYDFHDDPLYLEGNIILQASLGIDL